MGNEDNAYSGVISPGAASTSVDAKTLEGASLSEDGSLSNDSDLLIPTEKAVKTYVDNITDDLDLRLDDYEDNVVIDGSGKVSIPNATETTSKTTGALVSSGGIATSKDIYARNIVAKNDSDFSYIISRAIAGKYKIFACDNSDDKARWHFGSTDDAESGTAEGSNFFFNAFDNDGTFLARWLEINRATGVIKVGSTIDSSSKDTGALVSSGGIATSKDIYGRTIFAINDSAPSYIISRAPAGQYKIFACENSDSKARWHFGSTDDTESVSNAGSNFFIHGFNDDGTFLARWLEINRATGNIIAGANLTVTGALSKGSGSFNIKHPHPDKADTHRLVHSFVEAPGADLIYSGMVKLVNGKATINIDTEAGMEEGTFELLCRNVRRFTTNEGGFTRIKSSISGNLLSIEAEDLTCTDEVFWQVIGERQDEHMYDTDWTDKDGRVIVEPLNTEYVKMEEQDKKMREESEKELKEKENAKKTI